MADEARANVFGSPIRSLVLACSVAAIACSVLAFSLGDVAAIAARYRDDVQSGRFVLLARSATRTGLSAGRCDALNGVEGVRWAGAVLEARNIYPSTAPARPYELLTVTPGLIPAWFPGQAASARSGVFAGAGVGADLGLTDRSTLAMFDEPRIQPGGTANRVTIDRVLPRSPRRDSADRNLFQVSPAVGQAPTCYIDAEPSALESIDEALGAWFPPEDQVGVTAFLEGGGGGRSPEADLAARSSDRGWMAGSLVISVLATVLWYGRRNEFALYRLLGATRPTITGLLVVEAAITVLAPAVVGLAAAVLVSRDAIAILTGPELVTTAVSRLIVLDAASLMIAFLYLPLAATAVVARRSPFDQLKGF